MLTDTASPDTRRARNAALNLQESRAGALVLRSKPRYVLVELTQGCNLQCPMCRDRAIGYREREMDRDVLAHIAAELFPTAEMVDIRGWGESLLVSDVDDIVREVAAHGARCRVVTNLSFRKPATLDLLTEVGAMVDVSLDAAQQGPLAEARKGAKLPLITENLRRLVDGFARNGRPADSLRIVATVQPVTVPELAGLVRYAAEVGVPQIVLNAVTVAEGDPTGLHGREVEVDRAVDEAREVAAELGVDLFAGTSLGHCVPALKNSSTCIHPWSYLTVGYDGSVGYCDHLVGPIMQHYSQGHAGRTSLEEIWNGPRWQELRRWHADPHRADQRAFHGCFRCYQHRNVDFEDVFEPALERYRLGIEPVTGTR
ncbi:radical SAM protein [Saccharothrix stipae]